MYPTVDYIKHMRNYIHLTKGYTLKEATDIVIDIVAKHQKDPNVTVNIKNDKGDVDVEQMSLTSYLNYLNNDELIRVPSLTSYVTPDVRGSVHSDFMLHNTKERAIHKKAAFKAKLEGDMGKYTYHDTMQKSMKVFNNSLSGAYASKSTMLRNPSAHYTLTSMTRCIASIGNTITESMVAGNKYFKTIEHIKQYIMTCVVDSSWYKKEHILSDFNIRIPTVEETYQSIVHSFSNYNIYKPSSLLHLIEKVPDIVRAKIVYINDIYHLAKYNEDVVRKMLEEMTVKTNTITNDVSVLLQAPEDILILAKLICNEEIKGKYIDLPNLKDTELGTLLSSTVANCLEVFAKWRPLLNLLFRSNIFPIDIGNVRDMVRRCIVLSDTDSTCGSYDQWVKWYYGTYDFSHQSLPLVATLMTINSQTVEHYLNLFSRNMNIPEDKRGILKMKNEFYWPVFIPTDKNKHYFATATVQEGNIYNVPDIEIKGVHLISSRADQAIVKDVTQLMKDILYGIGENQMIIVSDYIKRVIGLEIAIARRVKNGDPTIFKLDSIKEPSAYKLDDKRSPIFHHNLWTAVFGDKYNFNLHPPYVAVKIPTVLTAKHKLSWYIKQLDLIDKSTALKLKKYLDTCSRDSLGVMCVPLHYCTEHGIPPEILKAADHRRVILDLLINAYLILETLGIYKKDGILLGEQYPNLAEVYSDEDRSLLYWL